MNADRIVRHVARRVLRPWDWLWDYFDRVVNRLDGEDFRAALAEFEASGEKAIPFDEVLSGHGLTRADLRWCASTTQSEAM